jgi:hypothetical protein
MPTVFINEGDDRNRIYAAPQRLRFADGEYLETYSLAEGDGSIWGPLEWYSDRLAPRARDWNNDGVLDLITCSMGRRLYFFKGQIVDGELRFERNKNLQYQGTDLVLPDRQFVDVLDYNNDGFMDVVCNTSEPAACVFYGDGSTSLPEPVVFTHPDGSLVQPYDHWKRRTGKRTGFEVTDWDLDGTRDLVVYQFHEGIFLYKGVNDTVFEKEKRLIKLFSHMAGCAVTDWDHNGIPDLLFGGDERRMIEVDRPAHVVVVYGEDTMHPPTQR